MKVAPILAIIIAILLCSAVFLGIGRSGTNPGPGPEPVPEPDDGYPEGISVDQGTCTVSYTADSEWHVYDLFEKYYIKPDGRYTWSLYEGFDLQGKSITLSPGYYRIAVDGLEFDVGFGGTLERTSSWEYDIGGAKHRVSVTYGIDADELIEKKKASRTYNEDCADEKTLTRHLFSDLPGLVDTGSTIVSLEKSLRSEFARIGGNASDRQAYADFLASFVQVAIPYPPSIYLPGEEWSEGEDYGTYGMDEYWASPLETLCVQTGDCEDTAVLLCSLYAVAGYATAVGGNSGHVFAGVALEDFVETSKDRLNQLDGVHGSILKLTVSTPVEGSCPSPLSETLFYAVETIYSQLPVGYLGSGSADFGNNTYWGISGFYPYQGAESGIQGSS